MKVGDKVIYVGREFSQLFIKGSQVYTIREIIEENSCLKVSEIKRPHSYCISNFILATDLMVALS
jgi:hypothetical protein